MWKYYENKNGKITLFNIEECDNCGAAVEAPNSVGGSAKDLKKYENLGMVERKMPRNQLIPNEKTGDCECERCCDD